MCTDISSQVEDVQGKYKNRFEDIRKNYRKYYKDFEASIPFSGPSLHFHTRALNLRQRVFDENSTKEQKELFLEMIYAVLVSWGMDSRRAKMVDFDVFKESISGIWASVLVAREYKLQNMDDEKWNVVKNIYKKIKVMSGNSHLVGNSKVMAHLLPDIVAPIDRRYTVAFLNDDEFTKRGMRTKIVKNTEGAKEEDETYKQWNVFYNITKGFFHKIAQDKDVQKFYSEKKCAYNWNTSLLKFIDNLVIGAKIL